MLKVRTNLKKNLLGVLALGISLTSLSACDRGASPGNFATTTVKTTALMVVPNRNRIDVLDMQTNRVTTTLETDDLPSDIAASPDGRMILVTNKNSGTISVYLRRDNDTFVKSNSVGSGRTPVGVAFNPNPQISEAYVAYEGDAQMLVLDTRDRNRSPKIIRTINLSDNFKAQPRRLVVNADGSRIYITDGLNDRVITLTRAGFNFTRNYSQSFDQNLGNVDLEGVVMDAQERLFIANNARSDVYVFNGRTGQVAQNIPLQDNQIVGQNQVGPKNLVVYKNPSTGAEKIYVSGFNASVISVIDPQSLRLLRNIPLFQNTTSRDSFNPVGVAVGTLSSKEDVIYVTNSAGLTISLIDPLTDTLKRNISTTISAASQDPLGNVITLGPVR